MTGAIGRRYGRALFELASEEKMAAEVGAGLVELAAAVESLEPGTLAPGLMTAEQREKLAQSLVTRVGGSSLLARFVGVLAANDRLDQLPAIRASYESLEDEAAGRVRVLVRSATPLSDGDRVAIRDRFAKITGRQVLDTVEVDAGLLGGITVEAAGRVYDGSIRTQLARLERKMAGQA